MAAAAMAVAGSGADFAWGHMKRHGWKKGQGLGRKGQGITDALKPKLKFDQSGVGHSMKDEFEFHWWDHVFNSAAKGITVDESKGEVTVEFKADKSEVSSKKIRRKMQKEMRNKLYANFVKSGTLQGGNFTAEEHENVEVTEVKDLSKIKTLTDDELVKACGGRTAHKGARHGQKMTAKLARVAESERLYLEQLEAKLKEKEKAKQEKERLKNEKNKPKETSIINPPVPNTETEDIDEEAKRKEEKAKRKQERKERKRLAKEAAKKGLEERLAPEIPCDVKEDSTGAKKKKKKKDKNKDLEKSEAITTKEITEPPKKKRKLSEHLVQEEIPTEPEKKKKKSKKEKKSKEGES